MFIIKKFLINYYSEPITKKLDELKKRKRPGEEILTWSPVLIEKAKKKNWLKVNEAWKRYGKFIEILDSEQDNYVKFRCFFCYREKMRAYISLELYGKNLGRDIRNEEIDNYKRGQTSKFAFSGGWFEEKNPNAWRNFYNEINEHKNSNSHRIAMSEAIRRFLSELEEEEKIIRTSMESTATDHIMRLVYHEAKLNIPLNNHSILSSMLKDMGVEIGYHHHNR